MSLQVCVLASGSSGNCIYVASPRTRILIDAGLSCRETMLRLQSVRADLSTVSAVCLTHEHHDHNGSLAVLHRRIRPALFANAGTIAAVERTERLRGLPWNVFTTGVPFTIDDLRIDPFSVPHDSYDPVGFIVSSGDVKVGIVTDMGMVTELIRARLSECRLVVVEANHDETLLRDSTRPWSLKQRIAGRQGHLSNAQAADLVADIAGHGLQVAFLAHLSTDCNTPELALAAVRNALRRRALETVLKLTYADRPSELVDLR